MKAYYEWFVAPENLNANILTIISIVLSALVSLGISAIYYWLGNRNNLRASVLYPMRRLIENSPSWKGYRALVEYEKDYSMKYLRASERTIIDKLISSYRDVCKYDYASVCAESLFSYFKYRLKKAGIDPTPVPVYIEDELVDVDFPPDMLYFHEDIARAVEQYPPEYDTEHCVDAVQHLFDVYCKKCYTDKKINFFDDFSILEVLKKAKNKNEWNEKFKCYADAKAKFLELRVLK